MRYIQLGFGHWEIGSDKNKERDVGVGFWFLMEPKEIGLLNIKKADRPADFTIWIDNLAAAKVLQERVNRAVMLTEAKALDDALRGVVQ